VNLTAIDDWLRAAAISAATFVSEDATCIATGLLIRAGRLDWSLGLSACVLGIFLGDLGLWSLGRVFGRRVLVWRWVRKRLSESRLEQLGDWFDRCGWMAILAARFLPGTRLPVYVAAGVLGRRAGRFVVWALLAALLWTPLLVLLVALLGDAVVEPLQWLFGSGWLSFAVALVALWLIVRVLPLCATTVGRAQCRAHVSRLWRWEFWPAWLFYAPLLPWIGYLAIRYRGLNTPTAANPGIVPHGGIVGESKFEILSRLPQEWIVPSALIPPGPACERVEQLLRIVAARGWNYPLILKPDAAQRGAGVRRVRDADAAARYLDEHPQPVLAQVYHPGPLEAGIFYYRMPGEPRGRIFSVTDKHFPVVVGDGVSTVRALIWRHPRLRMQAGTFLARLNGRAETILAAGEKLPLAIAGNHCQGTMFRDASHLITPALEEAVDAVAQRFEGFFYGRFDVRYADVSALMAGHGFAVVELNGVTSESTNLYDPEWSLLRAYGVLVRQWSILFAIGDRNRRLGHRPSSLGRVLADARNYYRSHRVNPLSD
jgi:membrane protein DedA with SNARE-associated domain